jgi:hypothetical protein
MDIRYFIDPETGLPHIYRHGVTEEDVEDVGQADTGRYLRVIYVPDPSPDSVFVITAYPLGWRALRALRRRRRRKR